MQDKQEGFLDPGDKRSNTDSVSSLNFKVSPDFKKEFKGFAVSQGVSMVDLLKEGFALVKEQRRK